MNSTSLHQKVLGIWAVLLCLLTLNLSHSSSAHAQAQEDYDPIVQTPTLLYDEAETVYLGNLARRNNGLPPLRWNRQLTYAARWFSWDSTENRTSGFCGHQDTLSRGPSDRALFFGYLGGAGAENAYCGYLDPQDAISGWMNSPGHRANLLDPNSREIGLGYYRRNSDGRGYVTQDFGNDPVYAPIIIENEAISTTNPDVNLYIYDRSSGGGFAEFGAATRMMVSNKSNFLGATWEPYNANKVWTLLSGNGWRHVYVKTRDVFNRNLTASDSIYLGDTVALDELSAAQMSTTESHVTLYDLDGGALPQVQFSLGWMADDTDESFVKWWGNGERVADANAWGGTAYRLYPGDGESFAWDGDWKFPIKNVPLVAYFRLKVNSNASSSEVARISVQGGSTDYVPLSLLGTDFTASNQYQEFALPFTFSPDSDNSFLLFKFWRSGSADVYVDAVSIFSTPQITTSPLTWAVPGNNYRGQGIWIRYTDGSQFSDISDATLALDSYQLSVDKLGAGSGIISSNPPGLNCGSDCSEDYPTDTPVELIASADSGSIFAGWSGDSDCLDGQVTMNVSMTCMATFNGPTYTLTVQSEGNGSGTVTSSPSGINCGTDCSEAYASGTVVTLTPIPASGHSFGGWTGACDGDENCVVTITSAKSVTAIFTLPSFSKTNPPNGSTQPATVTLSWEPLAGSTSYEYCYDKINDNACAWISNGTSTTKTIAGLTRGATYYWHVRAKGPWPIVYSNGSLTNSWSIAVARLPGAPSLISPPSNTVSPDNTPTFRWNPVPGAVTYEIQIDIQSTFVAPLVQSHIGPETEYTATPLSDGTYYWRVRAFNVLGEPGPWSGVRKIVIDTIAPLPPNLNAPTNNAAVRGTPTFSWLASATATRYQFAYDDTNNCPSPVYTSAILTTLSHRPPLMPVGTFHWCVKARDLAGNWSSWSASRLVTILPVIPVAPVLVSPATGSFTSDITPSFSWNAVPYGNTYEIWIDNTSNFAAPLVQSHTGAPGELTFTASDLPTGNPSKTYYWRVRGININAEPGAWSTVRSFVLDVIPPLAPVLKTPLNAVTVRGTPTYYWLAATTAIRYQFEYDDNGDFSSPVFTSAELGVLAYRPPIQPVGILYWHVRAKDRAGNWSPWSLARTITIQPTIPLAPALISPINGVMINDTTPTLLWNAVAYGNTYVVQIATNSSFTQNLQTISTGVGQVSITLDPLIAGRYYWRVRAVNVNAEVGAWSGYRSFTIFTP